MSILYLKKIAGSQVPSWAQWSINGGGSWSDFDYDDGNGNFWHSSTWEGSQISVNTEKGETVLTWEWRYNTGDSNPTVQITTDEDITFEYYA